MFGQFAIFAGLAVVFSYAASEIAKYGTAPINHIEILTYPVFFGTAANMFEGAGVMIPLRRAMKRPEKFNIVLSINFSIVTIVCLVFGIVGYLAYGKR